MLKGSCLCGKVSFEIDAEVVSSDACHCTQCRRQSGHYWASADVRRSALKICGEDSITWFYSSEKVRRGFCSTCGSFLFWDPPASDYTAVAMGSLDSPTGVKLEKHIFVADKGDYYAIEDGLPQNQQ